jgi:predicted nuclease of predicted toxin-antitoxin system
MRFLADMGVDLRVVKWLREQGHDAIHFLGSFLIYH